MNTVSLTPDFWEEFDRRLDAKLEQKLDAKLKPIYNWMQRQDLMIEKEIKRALQTHLEEQFKGFYTVASTIFPKRINSREGREITEFDGLYVLTNDIRVVRLYSPIPGKERLSPSTVFAPGVVAHLVIAEAKQNVTADKWRRKMQQMERIERLITECKTNPESVPKEVRHIGLQYFEPSVGLYIGGQDIDETVKNIVKEDIERKKARGIAQVMMGYLELNGARFSVHDEQNDYGAATFKGGKKNRFLRTTQAVHT